MRLPGHALVWLCLASGVGPVPGARAESGQELKQVMGRSRALMQGDRFEARPGDWVRYHMTLLAPPSSTLPQINVWVRISIPIHADPEHPLDSGTQWVEFEFSDETESDASRVVLKMLVQGDPRDTNAIRRMLVQAAGRRPMEIPRRYFQVTQESGGSCMKAEGPTCQAKGGKVVRGMTKKLYTKMGWVEATRVTVTYPKSGETAENWLSPKVPLFGLVKSDIPPGLFLELDTFGRGALSRLDESQAVPMPDPEELRQRMKEKIP